MGRLSSAFAAITVSLVVGSALVGVTAAPAATLSEGAQATTRDGNRSTDGRSISTQPAAVASSPILGSFSPLHTGIGGTVNALAWSTQDDTLYAGGDFFTAGAVAANNVAAWNGTAWSPLGAGVDDMVEELGPASQDDTLVAGGWFSNAGGLGASRIAAWSGTAWSPLGTGVTPGIVTSLMWDPQDDTLYAGGSFTSAGGVAAVGVAAWNGTAWSPLSTGMDMGSQVNALALDAQDDTLYAGGDFIIAGGSAANRVAAWDGTAWSPLGAGTSGAVYALDLDRGRGLLYVGGIFSRAGGGSQIASRVAVWDAGMQTPAWIPLRWGLGPNDVGVPGPVNALALDDSVLYLGGSFTSAGGDSNGDRIAKWTWDEPSGSLSALSGDPGDMIDIEGWGLIGVTGVTFNGPTTVPAASYTRDDSTTITDVVVPTTPGTYTVRVKAVGSTTAAGTVIGTFTVNNVNPPTPPPTYPPGSPTNVVATAGDKSATVTWTPPTDTGSFPVTNYQVQSSPDGKTCLVAAPALTCTVTGLTAGTDYRFRAQALNGAGWGTWSDYSTPVTPVTPLIFIIDSRRGTGADARRVYANGTTAGLTSTTLQPRFRFPGQTSFSYGYPLPLNESEGFTWSRTTGKTIYLYFEADGVRSNQVVIAAR